MLVLFGVIGTQREGHNPVPFLHQLLEERTNQTHLQTRQQREGRKMNLPKLEACGNFVREAIRIPFVVLFAFVIIAMLVAVTIWDRMHGRKAE